MVILRIVVSSFSDFIAFLAATNRLTSTWQISKALRASASSAGLPPTFAFLNLAIAAFERVKSCPDVSMFFQPPQSTEPGNRRVYPDCQTGAIHHRITGWFVISLSLLCHKAVRIEGRRPRRTSGAFARLRKPHDDFAEALTQLPRGAELFDILRLEPDVKFAVGGATLAPGRSRGASRRSRHRRRARL